MHSCRGPSASGDFTSDDADHGVRSIIGGPTAPPEAANFCPRFVASCSQGPRWRYTTGGSRAVSGVVASEPRPPLEMNKKLCVRAITSAKINK